MRAILINPQDCSVTEVEYTGNYKNINEHIGADYFDIVRIGDENEHTIFVDDNGLNNDTVERIGMFRVEGDYPAYLAGKGLILATDDEGESVAASMELDAVRAMIAFGKGCRVNGQPVFVELKAGEQITPQTFQNNRFWAV